MNLLNEVDKFLEQEEKKKLDSVVLDCHRPSGYSKCRRELYWMWTKYPVSNYPTATDIYRMSVGTWIHVGFAGVLKRMYGDRVREEIEFLVHPEGLKYPIVGHMDNVINIDDEVIGVELKTSFGRGIVSIAKSGEPKEEHAEQAKIYLACNPIDRFKIPYLGRDSFYRTEFDIVMTLESKEKFMDKVIAKFKYIEDCIDTKTTPERDFHAVVKDGEIRDKIQHKTIEYKSDWQCLYCNYRDSCYAEEIASFNICL